MKEYYITLSTGICGYDISLLIEAETELDARQKAYDEAQRMIQHMLRSLKVVHVEE